MNFMGLDFNAIKMLLWAKNLGVSFEKTLTLGRQGLACPTHRWHRAVRDFGIPGSREAIDRCLHHLPMQPLHAEELFRFLGAKEVVSVDYSDFEGATLLHDLNQPFPESQRGKFTLVVDGGTLEHIFDYPTALRNTLELVCDHGHFLTLIGAHSFMGHGFYQFSPELFFRVFSPENGFVLRKIVLYEFLKTDSDFYQVNDPAKTGYRTELRSKKPMCLAVLAQRIAGTPILVKPPMQSEYVSVWERNRQATNSAPSQPGLLRKFRIRLNPYWPYWLRHAKDIFLYHRDHGYPRLSNRRHYRLLKRKEIFCERSQMQNP